MKKIRLVIVEDQTIVREGLAAMFAGYPDIEVVGQAADGIQALQVIQETRPDVVTLDLIMPVQDGLTTIPQIRETAPDTRILVLTGHADRDLIYQAIKAGALGYILLDATCAQMLDAIREVANGRASLQPSLADMLIPESDPTSELLHSGDPLTAREMETLRLIAHGLNNQEIAAELVVRERTVARTISSLLAKLQLANRTQAALYALRSAMLAGTDTAPVPD